MRRLGGVCADAELTERIAWLMRRAGRRKRVPRRWRTTTVRTDLVATALSNAVGARQAWPTRARAHKGDRGQLQAPQDQEAAGVH